MARIYGLIGFPLGHSRSADYFNQRFIAEGITDSWYRLFPIPAVRDVIQLLAEVPDLRGLNVTIPYKEQIIPFLDQLDNTAARIGSVNVILVDREAGQPRMTGYNTDAAAFLETLPEKEKHRSALILGTGGAAKAVSYALGQAGIRSRFVTRQTPSTNDLTYDQVRKEPSILTEHTLIVNATPSGMFPDNSGCPDIPYERLGNRHLIYDLVYNPDPTLFMTRGARYGARTKSGTDMFIKQAELTYSLFMG